MRYFTTNLFSLFEQYALWNNIFCFVCLFVVIDIFKNHSFSSLCLRNILASTVHVVYCTLNVMFPASRNGQQETSNLL